jgi:hypothetical protein
MKHSAEEEEIQRRPTLSLLKGPLWPRNVNLKCWILAVKDRMCTSVVVLTADVPDINASTIKKCPHTGKARPTSQSVEG